MARTITRHEEQISTKTGRLDFSPAPDSSDIHPGTVTVTINTGPDSPSTGLHWHETHTEHLRIVQGCALVTVGDHTATFTKDDGVITIPRLVLHEVRRADNVEQGRAWKDTDLVMREWTDPADGDKVIFFRNIMSLIKDEKKTLLGKISTGLSIVVVAQAHDNYPVIWKGPTVLGKGFQQTVRRYLTFSVMAVVGFVGRLVGCRSEYEEYTPQRP
ncbi:hypothetical protein V8F06_007891 [Rhypophila decipiens]